MFVVTVKASPTHWLHPPLASLAPDYCFFPRVPLLLCLLSDHQLHCALAFLVHVQYKLFPLSLRCLIFPMKM